MLEGTMDYYRRKTTSLIEFEVVGRIRFYFLPTGCGSFRRDRATPFHGWSSNFDNKSSKNSRGMEMLILRLPVYVDFECRFPSISCWRMSRKEKLEFLRVESSLHVICDCVVGSLIETQCSLRRLNRRL